MKLGKLAKQLHKELTASPGKAATLGLGCLVAAYFWAPLIMPKRTPVAESPSIAAPIIAPAAPVHLAQDLIAAAGDTATRWNEVVAARNADPLMKTTKLDPSLRNPFETKQPIQTEPPASDPMAESPTDEPVTPVAPPVSWDIAQFKIDLRAISSGSRSRFAQINGQAMEEGEELSLAGEGVAEPVRFLVSEIQTEAVVLEAGGKCYTVRLPERGLPKNAVRLPAGARFTSHSSAG